MKDKVPYIEESLLIYLEQRFKPSEYTPGKDIEQIAYEAGSMKVVEHLRRLHDRQEN